MTIKKTTLSLCLSACVASGAFIPAQAHAFDFVQFFSDLFKSIPTAGSRSTKTDPNVKKDDKTSENFKIDKSLKKLSNCTNHYPWGSPIHRDKTKDADMFFLCKSSYASGYSLSHKAPLWVAQVLSPQNAQYKFQAPTSYTFDTQLPTDYQSDIKSYTNSGFEPSTMANVQQMLYSEISASESVFLTNTVPQVSVNMRQGIWQELESWTMAQLRLRGSLYVVTGPIYLNPPTHLGNEVGPLIPSHFYKVVIDPKINESISFVIPNSQIVTASTQNLAPGAERYPQTLASRAYRCADRGKSYCTLWDFTTQMSEVERLTQLKFINAMSDEHMIKLKVSDDFVQTKRYTKNAIN